MQSLLSEHLVRSGSYDGAPATVMRRVPEPAGRRFLAPPLTPDPAVTIGPQPRPFCRCQRPLPRTTLQLVPSTSPSRSIR